MSVNMAQVLELSDLVEANEEFALADENTGYNPYDNPGRCPGYSQENGESEG